MSKIVAGMKIGKLVALGKVKAHNKSSAFWAFKCSCGRQFEASSSHVMSGHTTSCGCGRSRSHLIHGYSKVKNRTYASWKAMRSRCLSATSLQWKWYGSRGIGICDRWSSFNLFLADMGERPAGKTLHRVDNEKGYTPDNCVWATPKEQASNNRGCFKSPNKTEEGV